MPGGVSSSANQGPGGPNIEGLQTLARMVERVVSRVAFKVKDVSVRFELVKFTDEGTPRTVVLTLGVPWVQVQDRTGENSTFDSISKHICFRGLHILLGEGEGERDGDDDETPPAILLGAQSVSDIITFARTSTPISDDKAAIPDGSSSSSSPSLSTRTDINMLIHSSHLRLSPKQLHLLIDTITSLSAASSLIPPSSPAPPIFVAPPIDPPRNARRPQVIPRALASISCIVLSRT